MLISIIEEKIWINAFEKQMWHPGMMIRSEKPKKQHQKLIRDFANWSLNFTTFVDHAKNRSMLDGAFKHNLDPMGRIFERANIQELKCPVYCRRGRERDVEASNLSMC